MSYRAGVLVTSCLVSSTLLLYDLGQAQVMAPSHSEPPPARRANTSHVGRWLVTVTHHVTLGELMAVMEEAATAAVLDGACAPTDIVLTNVTTGIVVDADGHVLTQLANLPPRHKSPTVVVQTYDRQVFRAKFVGRDAATGLCLLHVPGLPVSPPPMSSLTPPKPRAALPSARTPGKSPQMRIVLPMFQPANVAVPPGRPEEPPYLVWDEIVANWETEPLLTLPVGANCGVAVDHRNHLVAIVQPRNRRLRVLPIEDVKRITQRILAAGCSVPHGWLGIEGKTLTTLPPEERARFGTQANYGVVITGVVPGGPAEEAGLMPGDVILKVDNRPLEARRELNEVVVSHPAGDTLELLVERGGKTQTCRVILGSADDAPMLKPPPAEHLALGLVTSDLTAQLATFFGVPGGLLVTQVLPNSPAAAADLHPGDIIVGVDGQPIRQGEDLSIALIRVVGQGGDATAVTLDIIRERQAQRLVVALPLLSPKL